MNSNAFDTTLIREFGLRVGDALPGALGVAVERDGEVVPYAPVLGATEVRARTEHTTAPFRDGRTIRNARLSLIEQVAPGLDGCEIPNAYLLFGDDLDGIPVLLRYSDKPDVIVLDSNRYEWFPTESPTSPKSGLSALAFNAFDAAADIEMTVQSAWADDSSGPGGRQEPPGIER